MTKAAELTTDGWRGQPARKWSEHDVLSKAAAFAANLPSGQSLAIGFDGRAGSRELAKLAARAFSNLGVQCLVASDITPTPAVGRFVASQKSVGAGLIFTASHNPPGDFGLKVRLHDGLPPLQIPSIPFKQRESFTNLSFEEGKVPFQTDDRINEFYRQEICDPLAQIVEHFPGEVVVDAVFGALGSLSSSLKEVRWRRNIPAPFFFGITPDPVLRQEAEPEMAIALSECKNPENAIIFMTDGDGDRLCLYTKSSGYVTSTEQTMALIYVGLPVKQVISTYVIESTLREVALARHIDYRSTSVGFKNIVADWKTTDQNATIGVEPNGGLAFANSSTDFFERDGLATALLILKQFTSVKALDAAIKAVRALRRFDSRQFVSPMEPGQIRDVITTAWPRATVELHSNIYELTWPEGWRVLIRRSGTEPLTRCYVEGPGKLYDWFSGKVSK
jgi:phosphomannomutase